MTIGEDIIVPEAARTLAGLFRQRLRRTPHAIAYRHYDRRSNTWRDLTWEEMGRRIGRWQAALAETGLARGDRVALQLRNGPDWVAFEQAALGLGLVVVPLYQEDRPDNVAYILQDAGVKLLLLQDTARWRRLAHETARLDALDHIVLLEGEGETPPAGVSLAAAWLPPGEHPLHTVDAPEAALATIIYTSGTTGRPKGVMLSHANLLANAYACASVERFCAGDLFLSFLPLSHALERTGGYYLPMMTGAAVAYARSVQQLAEDLRQLRPTVLIAVPRIFEKVYARIRQQLAERPAPARWLFEATLACGRRRFAARQQRRREPLAALAWPLLARLVARKVASGFGGRLRFAVSGGAALPRPVADLFLGLGIDLLQGYGLTETSPVVSVNTPANNNPDSVGPPLPGVEVRIGARDELLIRGPGITRGYWNDRQATARLIDAEGWLHSGDQARLVNGRIHITGRLKEILVLSNGEKVPPADMEAAITLDPLFEHALVLGEGRPFLAALLCLNPEQWERLHPHHDLDDPAAQQAILQRLRPLLRDFPGYAKVRRVVLTLDEWTVESGLLTPTLKLKRTRVIERYAVRLAGLFEGDALA